MSADIRIAAPLLAQTARVYSERAAFAPLRPHFMCTWFHRVPDEPPHSTLVVPDGCVDLLSIRGTLRIAGPDREAQVEAIAPGTTVVGLRFQPGGAAAWLRVAVSEIIGARVPLEAFWGAEARSLARRIDEGGTPDEIARRLETALVEKLSVVTAPSDTWRSIVRLIRASRPQGVHLVRHLTDELGLSERTLLRRCRETFGYGPKTLDRILRFQRFLQLASTPDHAGMADLAIAAGYADQPHLIRETRELSGLTPAAVLAQIAR
jgi:AraC-like DNA-binding protein